MAVALLTSGRGVHPKTDVGSTPGRTRIQGKKTMKRLAISLSLVLVAGAVTAASLLRGHSGYSATYRFVAVDRGDIESTVSSVPSSATLATSSSTVATPRKSSTHRS